MSALHEFIDVKNTILQIRKTKVLPVLESAVFLQAFSEHCSVVPLDKVPILLSVNLGVAKTISGISSEGPVRDWISWRAREALQE